VERLSTLAGIVADSFAKASELLEEMASVHLSESVIESMTENVGEQVGDLLTSGHTFGSRQDWDWHCDATGQSVAYVSLDATGVRQQHGQGEAAQGRMAYVGMVYNPQGTTCPDPSPKESGCSSPGAPGSMKTRYVSGLYSLEQMGNLLRLQAEQVGMERAEVWLGISDGGNGLENCLEKNFPKVQAVILDFWHAAEYLWELATTVYPTDVGQRDALAEQWCSLLKAEGGAGMIAELQNWQPPVDRQEAHNKRDEVIGYFHNQVERMDYPDYLARGWHIGSGAVESGCKTVVGARLKGAGMRWSEHGTHAVCQLRALYRSEKGQWDAFWKRHWNKTKHLFYQQN
jgi:hypothetical protein